MAYTVVTDIQILIDRQRDIDDSYVAGITRLCTTHDVDLSDIIPTTLDRFTNERCGADGCECPTIGVESIKFGKVRVCRDVISEIKLASLVHRNASTLCLFCKIKRNSNGVCAGALHISHPIEDPVDDDGQPILDALGNVMLGLKSLINAGRVLMDLDNPTAQIWFDVVPGES